MACSSSGQSLLLIQVRELENPSYGSKVKDKPPLIYLGFTQVRILYTLLILRDRAEEARKAHNLEVTGSNPVPATTKIVVCVCFVFI